MPEATLEAFMEHGRVRPRVEESLAAAGEILTQAAAAGIDLQTVTDQLLEEGLAAFAEDFERLLVEIGKSLR
jgi:transaldolase/glucose-6-phosphate isomerase